MNSAFCRDPGSFRDPSGYVYSNGTKVIRGLSPSAILEFESAQTSGLIQAAIDQRLLIECRNASNVGMLGSVKGARSETFDFFLEHPRIQLITYPYEWTFSQLQDAALQHLNLQILACQYGFELSDGTAYNMQFDEGLPLHIDILSLRRYREGRPWEGYGQFCRQFLFPLLVESELGLPFQRFIRGNMAGLDAKELQRLIPWWKRYSSMNLLLHVHLQAIAIQNASSSDLSGHAIRVPEISKKRYIAMIESLWDWISKLKSGRHQKTYWADYASNNSYSNQESLDKMAFIEKVIRDWQCKSVIDVGGNAGDYSEAALAGGAARVYCVDSDIDALEIGYRKRKTKQLGLLPLVIDWCDPSPAQGWAGTERKSLQERLKADAVMALAVVHHIVVGSNVPLEAFVDQLFAHGDLVIVEFVPKSDPMVQGLLHNRDDVFPDYHEKNFIHLLEARSTIQAVKRIRQDGRVIFACKKF